LTKTIEEQSVVDRSELGNLSIKDLFFKYIRFLPVFVLSLALTLFGAWLYLRYATPIYRASGTMEIKNDEKSGSMADPRLNQLALNTGEQNIQNEIQVLRSKPLMERVVNSLHLQVDYNAVGKLSHLTFINKAPFYCRFLS
jgi:uncharacterized protein involved in exopolysaccharide biosynthesis